MIEFVKYEKRPEWEDCRSRDDGAGRTEEEEEVVMRRQRGMDAVHAWTRRTSIARSAVVGMRPSELEMTHGLPANDPRYHPQIHRRSPSPNQILRVHTKRRRYYGEEKRPSTLFEGILETAGGAEEEGNCVAMGSRWVACQSRLNESSVSDRRQEERVTAMDGGAFRRV